MRMNAGCSQKTDGPLDESETSPTDGSLLPRSGFNKMRNDSA